MNLRLASSHKPEYRPTTIGHVPERGRGRMVPDNRYTLVCKCGFMDTLLRTKKQQREIYKAHLLATVGKI